MLRSGFSTPFRLAVFGLTWLWAASCPATDLPDRAWLQAVTLLAHSERDQTVVLELPNGDSRILGAGEETQGVYTLRLLKVLDRRVELVATHPSVSDRKLRLWFDPRRRRPTARVASSAPAEPQELTQSVFQVRPPAAQAAETDPADQRR